LEGEERVTAGPELWTTGIPIPGLAARLARRAEDQGWDGMVLPDSQNLAGDPYVGLAMAAHATSRLRLGTGVTNPYTRHPAVTAAAIASVHAESGGRAVLGIGRGDSSLAHLGLAPAPVGAFARYVERVQLYLSGAEVAFDPPEGAGAPPDVGRLRLAGAPAKSRLEWLSGSLPKVPVDVVATGPRVIAAGARLADRLTFAVGADPDRVRWAVETARRARAEAGLDPGGISLGAYVNVVAHPDGDTARQLISGGLASFARFSAMHGTVAGPASEDDRRVLLEVQRSYDMAGHFRHGSPQSAALTDGFVDRFGVAGPPGLCTRRLRLLLDVGLERLVVVGPAAGADRQETARAASCFVEEVMPGLRPA